MIGGNIGYRVPDVGGRCWKHMLRGTRHWHHRVGVPDWGGCWPRGTRCWQPKVRVPDLGDPMLAN